MTRRTSLAAITLMTSILLIGCGVAFKNAADEFVRTQPPSAWGSQPPQHHRDVERQMILKLLKDPSSATFEFLALQRVVISASMTDPAVVPVWESQVLVNAKNSFGGYTGAKVWSFMYREGTLFAVSDPERGRSYIK